MSNREKAEKLADRPYTVVMAIENMAIDNRRYVAYAFEVKNCIGSGATQNFARADLLVARADLFESLLNDGLEVPEPNIERGSGGGVFRIDFGSAWWNGLEAK